jgi:hypothetical protein
MAHCHEMRVGQVYVCEDCGLELRVVKECHDVGEPTDKCACDPEGFQCCGKPLKLKEQPAD